MADEMAAKVACLGPNHLCKVSNAIHGFVATGWVANKFLDLVVPALGGLAPVRHRGAPLTGDVEVLANVELADVVLVVLEPALLGPKFCAESQFFIPNELDHVGGRIPGLKELYLLISYYNLS